MTKTKKDLPAIPKAICEGKLEIGNSALDCYVLDGGVRVLSHRKISEAFTAAYGGGSSRMPLRFLAAQNLEPFIDDELNSMLEHIKFTPPRGGRVVHGIRAEALPKICEALINARHSNALKEHQVSVAERAQILQNAFAQIGIIGLVDEATGYQDFRARDALAKILERYLSSDVQKWTQTFPLEFYREIYRLRGWEWKELQNGKKPQTPSIIGKDTDNLIYRRLAPGLLDELRDRNPKRTVRHHQWFNPEHGHPQLEKHIEGVIVVMRLSEDWKDFTQKVNKIYPLQWEKGTLFYEGAKSNTSGVKD